jgi:hypothetical protein
MLVVRIFATALILGILLAVAPPVAMAGGRSIPKDRAQLSNGDWFPYVISKLGPLEWWSFAASSAEVRREDYASDWGYELAKQNTWEFPRFCFSLFRPKPEVFSSLLETVGQYKGDVVWIMHDNCIGAMPFHPTFYTPVGVEHAEAIKNVIQNPPVPDSDFVKRALADIPRFCTYLETALGLKEKIPYDFDPQWLTREGLAASRGEFDEFLEAGSWSVILARDPEKYGSTFQPTSPEDRSLSFGIGMFEHDALFRELGADWDKFRRNGSTGPILPDYPLLSRLNDIAGDAVYERGEVDALLAEYLRAQSAVKDPRALRGVDKLIRITRWAQKLGVGIYFSGQ